MAGIKDIAKAAGVSISTVSYALNGSTKITEKTRQKVIAIADELNYVPNLAARTLKKQQTNIIGVYLADYDGSFYGELLNGIKKGLEALGYEMIVCSGHKSHLFLQERLIDGAIILDWTFKTEEIEKLADRGHPIVVLDREIHKKSVRKVLLDNKGGSTLAIGKMIASNTKKVWLVIGPDAFDSMERLKASINELERFCINYEVIQGSFTESSGYEAAGKIMGKVPPLPIDIFSFNDEMAIGMYKYFENRPEVIGKDVRIIGFDNIELGSFLQPKLASISYSKQHWGKKAAEKIVQIINGKDTEDEVIYTNFVPGESFL